MSINKSRKALRALIIDDDSVDVALCVKELQRAKFTVAYDVAETREQVDELFARQTYDLVLCDYRLPQWTGLEVLVAIRQRGHDVPFILVAGVLGEETAVDCIKAGASDCVLKNHLSRLPAAVHRALEAAGLREDHRKTLEALLESEKQYRMLFENNPNPMWVFDVDSLKFLAVNDAAVHRYGYSRDEFLSMSILDIRDPTNRPGVSGAVAETGPGLDTEMCVWQHRKKDGSIIDVEVTGHSLTFAGRRAQLVLGHDVTARRKAERALQKSEQRYRSLVMATSQVVWSTAPNGEVVEDLPSWREFSGMSEQEILGLGWLNIIHPDDRERTAKIWVNAVTTRTLYSAQMRARRKDGQYRIFMVRGVPVLEDNGDIREWVGACSDVTDQRQLEMQFLQAQKMEAVGQLAGGVAHDFNNLLGVITGYSELLQGRLADNDQLQKYAEEITKAGLSAASLTRQLLAFSRQQVLELKVLDLNIVIANMKKLLGRLISEDIELTTVPGPNLGRVKADQTQLEQVIMNLAVNARDAMPKGGKLIIETSNVELNDRDALSHSLLPPGKYVLLAVGDNGVGMDAATQAHIFEPFFTTKERGKGTGLGLATVYGIIKQSGGHIWFYSEPQHGTTFKIYLPTVADNAGVSSVTVPTTVLRGTETVLLVEDENSLRALTRNLLETGGYTVIEASDATQAAEIAGRHDGPIQLLLTDVILPGVNGRGLSEALAPKRPEMRVLFMSGYTDATISSRGILDSGTFLLHKPFTRRALLNKVREVLDALRAKPANASGN